MQGWLYNTSVNPDEYADIFAARGASYHAAMQCHRNARNAEFDALFVRNPVNPGQTVLDIPAGGGYLARRLPASVQVTELEVTRGFTPQLRVVPTYGEWGVGTFDHVVCLAALHHIQEQDRFVAQLAAHTAPGGIIHLADVDITQHIVLFLDGFVGRYNSTGHHGKYINAHSFTNIPGTQCLVSEIRDCPWRFPDTNSALDFSAALFGLVNYPRTEFRDAIQHFVGMREDSGVVLLDWKLRYVDLKVI